MRINSRLPAREEHVNFSARPKREGSSKDLFHVLQLNLVNVIHAVRIHKARRAFHIAPIREINNKVSAAAGPSAQRPMIVNLLVGRASEIPPRIQLFHSQEEIDIVT